MPDPSLLDRKALAAAFGTHRQTIVKWEQAGMPIAERGRRGRPSRYALPAVVAWFVARELAARGVDGAALDPTAERALLDRRRREEVEARLARTRGEWLLRTDFQRVLGKAVTEIRAKLLAAPRAWALALTKAATERGPAGVEQALMARVREILEALAGLPCERTTTDETTTAEARR